jgi:chemotaxis protein MotB
MKSGIMKLSVLPAAIIAVALLAQGCVSTKKYKDLQSDYSALQAKQSELDKQYQQGQQGLSSTTTRVKSLEEQLAAERSNVTALQAALDKCLTSSGQGF